MARKKETYAASKLPAAFEALHGPYSEDHHSLWWVAAPMVRIAAHGANDGVDELDGLYEQIVPQHRPALAGIVYWQGGTGLTVPRRLGQPEYEITGVVWGNDGGKHDAIFPLSLIDGALAPSPHPLMFDPGRNTEMLFRDETERLHKRMTALLITTWILADQPTIGRKSFLNRNGQDTIQYDWRTMQAKPELPRSITVATLRQVQKHATPGDREERDSKWKLTKQHIVRGHWRQQAVGTGRAYRKPTYVPPYIKGPEGGELLPQVPLVQIWRR